jgi:glycine/D-amino acid oxidase-like deaminating enzyme
LNTRFPILIIGQGISGTMLSWFLHKANIPFMIMDDAKENTASKVAAGIINPVTGRRIVKTWMIDDVMPFAVNVYREMGTFLNIDVCSEKQLIDFFPTLQMKNAFEERLDENADYLRNSNEKDFHRYFNYDYGYGSIAPAYVIQVAAILQHWREYLIKHHLLLEEKFQIESIQISDEKIIYHHIVADKIIFADGIQSETNRWFKHLPFSFNKGEALLVEIPELPDAYIFKKKYTLCPLKNNLFWLGANYTWNYDNDLPTSAFYDEASVMLKNFIKVPYSVHQHIAAIRPANIERRPFVGFHPVHKNIGIFNGMGAKGTSLAPYFAHQLANHINLHTPIHPEADVNRFLKILSRN